MPVLSGGALYQLYGAGAGSDAATLYLIDEQMVTAYMPEATIEVITEDPYPVARTRADRPFTVVVNAQGLLPGDPLAPEAAKKVFVETAAVDYTKEENRIAVDGNYVEDILGDFYLVGNGQVSRTQTTALESTLPFKQRGEERFYVYALPDTDLGWLQIQSETVQVWPIADAAISGINDGDHFKEDLPRVTVTFSDLYPSSQTYVHLYPGTQQVGATDPRQLDSSIVEANTLVPQDAEVVLTNWEEDVIRNEETVLPTGTWTLEAVTVTPFNNGEPEVLTWVTFTVDRTIQFRGNIVTAE